MKALIEKKAEAIKMRLGGVKQSTIVKTLGVSKGIVSLWLKDITIPNVYKEKIYIERYGHSSGVTYVGKQGYISCNHCKQSKKVDYFRKKKGYTSPNLRSAYRSYCVTCSNEKILSYNKDVKIKAINKLGGKCACGCDDERILEIHHINKNGKQEREKLSKYGLRSKITKMTSPDAKKEYMLVCAVCHEAEHVMMDYPNAKYEIKYLKDNNQS